ncbi:MAG: gliding motility-associated C-terminal domain-containing protein [Flavobacteriales bacterium]|nr:gliding motility-associated C-terminal domain-containing protein [Flavobacteriales bacterium]
MKNDLRDLLQERFAGHEAPVDPGLWQAISGQLAAAAPAADGLGDLLKDRFKDHELEPDPGVWDGISQQLGHGAAAGSAAGGSGFGGWIAAGIAATALTGGLLFWTLSPDTTPTIPVAEVPSTPAPAPPPQGDQPPAVVTTPLTAIPAVTGTPANTSAASAPASAQAVPPATSAPQDAPAMDAPIGARDRDADAPERIEPEKPGAHRAEVDRIIDQLIKQTINEPVVAQTESVPTAGLVPGQQPPTLPADDGSEEPNGADEMGVPAADPVVWIPNAFSPGQRDGVNDELEVVAKGLTNVQVRIYSLDSRLVFKSGDLHPWDGRDLGGQLCPQGYYFYAIEGLDGNDKAFSKGQTIYLFR